MTIVFDKRCTGNECLSQLDAKNLTFNFEGAQLSKLDYSSPEGRALYERSGQKHLPIVIFGADVVKQKEGFEKIKHKLLPFDDTNDFVYPIGQSWNPTAEICDDGVDNTGNGKIDCADPTCDESIICRKEQKGHIDLFLTPNCSFGRRALVETAKVLEEFNKKKPSVDLALIYLGHVQNGKPVSMFGSAETIESLRQVCAQKYYKKNHKFLEYAACRASRDKEDNWKECLAPGMNMNVLEKCADGEEGEGLLISSIQQAESLRISISPVWLFNNRFKTIGLLTREKIRAELCRRNPDIDNCR